MIRSLLIGLGLSLAVCAHSAAYAAEGPVCRDDRPHYVVGSQCVYLVRSSRSRAFELDDEARFDDFVDRAREAGAMAERLRSSSNIVVLRAADGASACAFCGQGFQDAVQAMASERYMYEAGNAELLMHGEFIVQLQDRQLAADVEELIKSNGGVVVTEPSSAPYQFLIRFPDVSPEEALKRINRIHQSTLVRFAEPHFTQIRRWTQPSVRDRGPEPSRASGYGEPQGTTEETAESGDAPAGSAGERLDQPEALALPEEDPCQALPNDEYADYQWALCNDGIDGRVLDADIDAPEAWSKVACSSSVVVAVLDDGVDEAHPQLAGRTIAAHDATGRQDLSNPTDFDYHGTAVAGIIAASTNDNTHIAGVCGNAKIMPIRIGFKTEGSHHWEVEDSDIYIVDAIYHAVEHGASVINSSWSFAIAKGNIEAAIEYAVVDEGRLMVFSAGNDGGPVTYPANLTVSSSNATVRESVIAVGASTSQDQLAPTSSHGLGLTVVAPGWDILTLDLPGKRGYYWYDWAWFYETSAAAPFVSGVAALLLSAHPEASPAEIRRWIEEGADDLGDPFQFGSGRLNALGAVEAAMGAAAGTLPQPARTP